MKIYNIEFLSPIYFSLIILVFVFVFFFYKKQKSTNEFLFFNDLKKVFKLNNFWLIGKGIVICLIIISFSFLLSNPNTTNKSENISKNGIDIALILDISTSMNANDLDPTRIEAAKKIINDFIKSQETNRLGLVLFAGVPFVSIPLTFDYKILTETINNISTDNIDQSYNELSGTAIGDAILMGGAMFEKNDKEREKVIILITDGEATHGISPEAAAIYSKDNKIKIYTIGIGSETGGEITYYFGGFQQKQKIPPLNENALKEISKITEGEFFRATDNNSLEKIFEYLEKLEKSDIEVETKKEYSTNYEIFTYTILLLLAIYISLIFYKREL